MVLKREQGEKGRAINVDLLVLSFFGTCVESERLVLAPVLALFHESRLCHFGGHSSGMAEGIVAQRMDDEMHVIMCLVCRGTQPTSTL